MRDNSQHIKERRVYGQPQEQYDHLFGFLKSKNKKKKEKLDIKQRESNIALTAQQNAIARAKAQAEVHRAEAEKMKAIAAMKQAEKAQVQLKGAEANNHIRYIVAGVAVLLLVGGAYVVAQMVKQGKKSKEIAERIAKAQALLNKTPSPAPALAV